MRHISTLPTTQPVLFDKYASMTMLKKSRLYPICLMFWTPVLSLAYSYFSINIWGILKMHTYLKRWYLYITCQSLIELR